MVTLDQALTASEFHEDGCHEVHGSRGGLIRVVCYRWRRNGRTITWKTRPGEFRVPIKYGLRSYDYLTDGNNGMHVPEDCPLNIQATIGPGERL